MNVSFEVLQGEEWVEFPEDPTGFVYENGGFVVAYGKGKILSDAWQDAGRPKEFRITQTNFSCLARAEPAEGLNEINQEHGSQQEGENSEHRQL